MNANLLLSVEPQPHWPEMAVLGLVALAAGIPALWLVGRAIEAHERAALRRRLRVMREN